MPRSENDAQVLQYPPPNELDVSSTEKEHSNGLDLKDLISTCYSLQRQPNPQQDLGFSWKKKLGLQPDSGQWNENSPKRYSMGRGGILNQEHPMLNNIFLN